VNEWLVILWAQLIYTNQQAFVLNQKPLKIIPRICQLPEQQCYAMLCLPDLFFPPTHKRKKKAVWLHETKASQCWFAGSVSCMPWRLCLFSVLGVLRCRFCALFNNYTMARAYSPKSRKGEWRLYHLLHAWASEL